MTNIQKIKRIICATILCWRFPFLKYYQYRNKFWQDSCWYYAVDEGWRYLALQMFEEIRRELKREGKPFDSFRIYDVKEKQGCLDINCSGDYDSSVEKIVDKYDYISFRTCNKCGAPAFGYTEHPWILPYCKRCAPRNTEIYKFGTPKNKWYGVYSLMDKGDKPVVLPEENKTTI